MSRPSSAIGGLLLACALACQTQSTPPGPMAGQGGAGGTGRGGSSGRGGSGGAGGSGGGQGGSAGSGGSGGMADAAGPDSAGEVATEVAGSDCQAGQLACDTGVKLPRSIKDTGLFAAGDPTKPSDRLVAYRPSYELWSDGLHKQRYLLLPRGGKIDNTSATRWSFPVGTVMVKTFLHDAGGGMRPVETRLIRKIADPVEPYEFAVYRWNTAGTDAELADITDPVPVPVTVAGRSFMHNIPSKVHCGDCHTANAQLGSAVIGFTELHLADKLQPADPEPQLQALGKRSLFTTAVSATAPVITDANPVLQRVKRFMYAQCVHCHNGQGANPIDLRPEVFVANTVGKVPESPGVEAPPGWFRVRPRMPERSVVYLQTLGGNLPDTLRVMPPIGVQIRDLPPFSDELENLKTWINSLPLN